MKEEKIISYDSTPIHCYIWDKVDNPKGTIQLAHGMSEHAGRYAHFAKFLNTQGYIVFASDHRAHGKTEPQESIGHHEGNIYQKTLDDLVFLYNHFKSKYKLPIVFVGHSYGSFLGQGFLEKETDVKGVALCGSAYMGRFVPALGIALVTPMWLISSSYRPKMVNKLSDVMFSKIYKGEKGAMLWITRDEEMRNSYLNDSLAGVDMSFNFDRSMLMSFFNTYKKSNLAKLNPLTPIGIFSGTKDPIGGKKASKATKLRNLYKKCGVVDCSIKLYEDARHELINETNREEVFADILNFVDRCFAQ